MSDLVGNHIVGFPMRQLKYCKMSWIEKDGLSCKLMHCNRNVITSLDILNSFQSLYQIFAI